MNVRVRERIAAWLWEGEEVGRGGEAGQGRLLGMNEVALQEQGQGRLLGMEMAAPQEQGQGIVTGIKNAAPEKQWQGLQGCLLGQD